MFTELKLLTLGASLTLTITTSAIGEMSVLALLRKTDEKGENNTGEGHDILDKPLVLTGTPEELDKAFVETLMEAELVKKQFRSSLGELKKEADEALKKKREAQKTSTPAKPAAVSKPTEKETPKANEKPEEAPLPDLFSRTSSLPEPPVAVVSSTPPEDVEEEADTRMAA